MKTYISIKTSFEALHRWVKAPQVVSFLRDFHRHMFFVELDISVSHDDRELEFILVKRALESYLNTIPKKSDLSCEMMAKLIIGWVQANYGDAREIICSVFEDNENGATVVA